MLTVLLFSNFQSISHRVGPDRCAVREIMFLPRGQSDMLRAVVSKAQPDMTRVEVFPQKVV